MEWQFSQGAELSPAAAWSAYSWIRPCR